MQMRYWKCPVALTRLLCVTLLGSFTACGPKTAQDHFDRAMGAMKKKDYLRARIDLIKAIKLSPQFTEAFYQQAVAATELHDLSSAYDSLQVAERLDRKPANEYYNIDIRLRLGLLLLYGHDYHGARQRAQWVLTRDPHNAKAHELMAFVFSAQAVPQLATQELDEVLNSDPRNLQARMMRAAIHFAAAESEEAIHQMQLAVEQTGRSPQPLLALG